MFQTLQKFPLFSPFLSPPPHPHLPHTPAPVQVEIHMHFVDSSNWNITKRRKNSPKKTNNSVFIIVSFLPSREGKVPLKNMGKEEMAYPLAPSSSVSFILVKTFRALNQEPAWLSFGELLPNTFIFSQRK